MSDFDYSLDIDESYQGMYKYDNRFGWEDDGPPEAYYRPRNYNNSFMNSQYSEAYGAYRGGYGRNGGYAPPRMRPYLPRGPSRPAPLGFGPMRMPPRRGPPMHKAAEFLAECEVAPQYIRILPRELLDMIEPGYCGLCGQNLETFAVAKLHYNCKNHYKSQKKFMSQFNQHGANQPNDVPMKARSLYCELCDVHITSQSHADSHYAGRSHLSVVEGRKPPKNPMLLQPAMKARVEHLIRREKKNPPKKPDPADIKEVMAAPLDKNVPPELYCPICRIGVTCSEQMTHHLNGKKHLTKEKQFILNTMKGKTTGNDAANKNGGAAGEEANENGGAAEEEDDEEDQTVANAEDWGNDGEGGEDWDANN